MAVKTLTINDRFVSARESETILDAAKDAGIHIPTLCYLEGVSEAGTCRLCLVEMGMEHVSLAYQFPQRSVDLSHNRFGIDRNRCVLCTRCIRVCDEIEGAHTVNY